MLFPICTWNFCFSFRISVYFQLFCNQVNILCHHYEIFFRESSVKVDKYVEKRKQIARDGYKDLKNLSLIIYLNERRNPILFKLVRQRVKFQARQVQKLVDHFHRTFCPVLTNAIPKPNAPPMRIAASPTSAQIIPFYDDSKFGIIVDWVNPVYLICNFVLNLENLHVFLNSTFTISPVSLIFVLNFRTEDYIICWDV